MNQFLQNHICLVTGGTQGIGWALVQALADHGGKVYACGLSPRNLAQAHETLKSLPWQNQIHLAQCDVTDRAVLQAWIEQIYQENGRIDLLINNAAFVQWEDVLAMSVEASQRTLRVNVEAMLLTVHQVLPWMLAAGRGHIVNMGSITAHILVPGASAVYAASKAAVDVYTQTLQMELANSPIHATLVRLGTTAGTDFFKQHVRPTRMARLTQYLPPLTPPQVATAVLRAIQKKQNILTLPGYLAPLATIYLLFPRFSRWLANLGSANQPDFGKVTWQYRSKHDT